MDSEPRQFYFDERLEKPLQEYANTNFRKGDLVTIMRMLNGVASIVRKMEIKSITNLGNPVFFQLQ